MKEFHPSEFGKTMKNHPTQGVFSKPSNLQNVSNSDDEEEQVENALELFDEEDESGGILHPFLKGEMSLYVSSSNIYWVKFFPDTQELMIQYKRQPGAYPYLYSSSLEEAKSLLNAKSKGQFAAAVFRPRPFRRVPSSYSTAWNK